MKPINIIIVTTVVAILLVTNLILFFDYRINVFNPFASVSLLTACPFFYAIAAAKLKKRK